jgi:signal transduction histidine kinase
MDSDRLQQLLARARSFADLDDAAGLAEAFADAARELTGARYAALAILNSDGDTLEHLYTAGVDPLDRLEIGAMPHGRGVFGELLWGRREPLRLREVSTHPRSWGFPAGHPRMATFLAVPILLRDRTWGALYVAEKTSGEFDDDDEHVLALLAVQAHALIRAIECTQREREQAAALDRAIREAEATSEIALALAGEIELDRVLELICKRSRALVAARSMVLALLDDGELVVQVASGERATELVGRRLSLERSAAGQVVRTSASIAVPLVLRGRVVGVLEALDRLEDGPAFSDDDERLLLAFATGASVAVATSRRFADEARRRTAEAAESERARWARELHDGVLQDLAALTLVFAELEQDLPEAAPGLGERAAELLAQSIVSLRALIADLRPIGLQELGLQAALEELAQRYIPLAREGPDIQVRIDLDYERGRAPDRPPAELESTAYRIVQEALANALRHSNADHVDVDVHERDGQLTLRIRDDGAGFDAENLSVGFGLTSMRERAALAGGALLLDTSPGAGTLVEARIPVGRRSGREAVGPGVANQVRAPDAGRLGADTRAMGVDSSHADAQLHSDLGIGVALDQ